MTDINQLNKTINDEIRTLKNPKHVVPKKEALAYITTHLSRIKELTEKGKSGEIDPTEKKEVYIRAEAVREETEHLSSIDITSGVRGSLRKTYEKSLKDIKEVYGPM